METTQKQDLREAWERFEETQKPTEPKKKRKRKPTEATPTEATPTEATPTEETPTEETPTEETTTDEKAKQKYPRYSTVYTFENNGYNVSTKDKAKLPSRWHSVMTYIPVDRLKMFLRGKPWLLHWAYAHHDKDPKEPHTHILLYIKDAKTSSALIKLFDRFDAQTRKADELPSNTFDEIPEDVTVLWRYLLHLDDPDKYQYPSECRISDDAQWWNKYEITDGENDPVKNTALAMFDDLLEGVPTREFIRRYGKEGLYHLKQTEYAVARHNNEVSGKYIKFDEMLLKVLVDSSNYTEEEIDSFWKILHWVQRECVESYGNKIDFYSTERIIKDA